MVDHKFNKTSNILEVNFTGNVTLTEIVDYIIQTKNNKEYPRTLKLLTNTKNTNFNFSIEDLNTIVEENNKSLKNYDCIIDAIIVDNPKNTVLSILYQELTKTNKYKFEIFATKAVAINWLNNS